MIAQFIAVHRPRWVAKVTIAVARPRIWWGVTVCSEKAADHRTINSNSIAYTPMLTIGIAVLHWNVYFRRVYHPPQQQTLLVQHFLISLLNEPWWFEDKVMAVAVG